MLLAPHFCNWEWLLGAGAATFQLPIDVVYQTLRVKSVDAYLREARARFGGKPIPREDFIYELMSRAGTPRGYALIADQTPRRDDKKHWTRMLNRDTAFFVGRREDRAVPRRARCSTSTCGACVAATTRCGSLRSPSRRTRSATSATTIRR